MDFIEFTERGAKFEIQGPDARGDYLALVRPPGGDPETFTGNRWDGICRAVDTWIAAKLPVPTPDSFQGFDFKIWRHEYRWVERWKVLTRGELLLWFESGEMPTVAEAVDLAECDGDIVLLAYDGSGNLLLDKSEAAKRQLASYDIELPGCGSP